MQLPGAGGQSKLFPFYVADGSITTGGTAQLVLPQTPQRAFFFFQNTSSGLMTLEFGSARATAVLTAGAISTINVTNAGFGFSKPPVVRFAGGGNAGNSTYLGLNQPGGEGPNSMLTAGRPAKAHCVMTGSAPNQTVASIAVDDPGAGYVIAPYVFIQNSDLDPYGAATPSATVGLQFQAGASLYVNGTSCNTDSVSVWGATTGQTFVCRWMA